MNARKRKQRIPTKPTASIMARIGQKLKESGQYVISIGNECWSPRFYTSFRLELRPSGKASPWFYNTPCTPELLERELDKMLGA